MKNKIKKNKRRVLMKLVLQIQQRKTNLISRNNKYIIQNKNMEHRTQKNKYHNKSDVINV